MHDTWPDVDLDTYLALHPNSEYECDEWAEICLSPDDSRSEYIVTHVLAEPLPEPAYFAPELIVELDCRWTKGIRFSRLEPWVLLACDSGVQLTHLNGDVLQSWKACSEESNESCPQVDEARFSYDGRTVFDIRKDRYVWVHTPDQPQSKSIKLGPHESFISAVERHASGTIAIATGNGTIQVYNAAGELMQRLYVDVKVSPVSQLIFSADGNVLFARDHLDVIHQWSVSTKYGLEVYKWIDPINDADWNQLTQ